MRQRTINALTGSDLELPLGWHDLRVDARDLDAGVQAGLVMRLDDVAAIHLAGTDTAVIRPLWTWEAAHRPLGPSVGCIFVLHQGVFLLQTEPSLVF